MVEKAAERFGVEIMDPLNMPLDRHTATLAEELESNKTGLYVCANESQL